MQATTCKYCGNGLEGKRKGAIYCSPSCRVRACIERNTLTYSTDGQIIISPEFNPEKVLKLYYHLCYLADKFRQYEPSSSDPGLSTDAIANKYIGLKNRMSDEELIKSLL